MSDLPFLMQVSITGITKQSHFVISTAQFSHKIVLKLRVGSCFVVAYDKGKAVGNIYQQGSIKFSLIQRVRISQALQTSRPGGTATQKSFALILFTTASNWNTTFSTNLGR